MERLVGNAQGQAAVEGEITLPGGLREEARVLSPAPWWCWKTWRPSRIR